MELKVIKQQELLGKEFKIYGDFDNPLFMAKEIANWIDYDESKVGQMLKSVDEDEKLTSPIFYSGQVREMYFLTEEGLYEVLMQSRKPIAKEFKKKVKEILKEIRKNGGYIASHEDDTDEEIMARALMVAQKTIEKKNERILALETKVEEQKPLVEFADTLLKSKSSILIGDFAKILCEENLNIGEVRLFEWLREKGYVYKEHKTNKPYQKYIDSGLFEVKTGVVKSAFRDIQTFTIKVKPKGQLYFYNKLKEDGRFNK